MNNKDFKELVDTFSKGKSWVEVTNVNSSRSSVEFNYESSTVSYLLVTFNTDGIECEREFPTEFIPLEIIQLYSLWLSEVSGDASEEEPLTVSEDELEEIRPTVEKLQEEIKDFKLQKLEQSYKREILDLKRKHESYGEFSAEIDKAKTRYINLISKLGEELNEHFDSLALVMIWLMEVNDEIREDARKRRGEVYGE